MPSARGHLARLAVVACCGSLLLGALAGCETTQEKAAEHRAEAARILEAREKRQQRKQKKSKDEKQDDKEGRTR